MKRIYITSGIILICIIIGMLIYDYSHNKNENIVLNETSYMKQENIIKNDIITNEVIENTERIIENSVTNEDTEIILPQDTHQSQETVKVETNIPRTQDSSKQKESSETAETSSHPQTENNTATQTSTDGQPIKTFVIEGSDEKHLIKNDKGHWYTDSGWVECTPDMIGIQNN